MNRLAVCSLILLTLAAVPVAARKPPPPAEGWAAEDPAPSLYRPLPRADTLLVGATILDGADRRIDGGDVLLRDGRIVAVGPNLPRPEGVTIIDAAGLWITPGIIDLHSHDGTYVVPLNASDDGASDVSEISNPNAAGAWVEHGINVQDPAFFRALAGGVTTLQILPGSVPLIGGRSVVLKTVPANHVQAMKFPGAAQGVKMSCGENPKSHFGNKGIAPNSRMGGVAMLRQIFGKARHRQGEERGRRGPSHGGDPEARTLAGILDGSLPVHLHCYRADDIAVMLNLAREFGFRIAAVHHAAEAYKVSTLLRDAGTCAVVWPDWWGFKTEAADAIRANAAFVDAAGGCVALHSDSGIVGQHLNLEAAKAMGAGNRAGVQVAPEHAIGWITANPAKVLGLGDRIGSIEPGKNADLVLWTGNPFSVYSHATKVFIDGALVFDRSDPARQPRSDFEIGRPTSDRRR